MNDIINSGLEYNDFTMDFEKPLVPKPIIHRCKDNTLVCLNYDNPYGKQIPKMSDSHLLNTVNYIKKNATKYAAENHGYVCDDVVADMYAAASSLQGDMACYYAEQEITHYCNNGQSKEELYDEYCAKYKLSTYQKEAKLRGLL